MNGSGGCLETIEAALGQSGSALSRALQVLGVQIDGRGTCLLIEHDDFGEALIADNRWTMDRAQTLDHLRSHALVELHQEHGFRRLAVLVQPRGDEWDLDAEGCQLALAALRVTEALADIAARFDASGDAEDDADAVALDFGGAGAELAGPQDERRMIAAGTAT